MAESRQEIVRNAVLFLNDPKVRPLVRAARRGRSVQLLPPSLLRGLVADAPRSQVQSSSLTQRIEFLQGKGLSEPEIQQALHEAANPGSSAPAPAASLTSAVAAPPAYARASAAPQYAPAPQQGGYVPYGNVYAVPPPEPPKRDWRDVFVSLNERAQRASEGVTGWDVVVMGSAGAEEMVLRMNSC